MLQLLTENRKAFDSCRRKETENDIFALVLLDVVSALFLGTQSVRVWRNI